MGKDVCELKYYNGVQSRKVEWLWYPYIPYGKVTIIQGDPGEGKTTFVLNLTSLLTRGQAIPGCAKQKTAITVIYQNAEDGIEDTIKPRLESVGADCSKVAYLDHNGETFSLSDKSIEQAIARSGAKLLVLDPLQAFLGDVDMNRANDTRAIMQKITHIAERTGCAIILVGHMDKTIGGKFLYRGLGSIDLMAAARSVLMIGRVKGRPGIRAIFHIKSNLALEGKPITFELLDSYKFRWIEDYEISQDELLGESTKCKTSKLELAMNKLGELLNSKRLTAIECYSICKKIGINTRTVAKAKSILGIISKKDSGKWYWELSNGVANE